MCKRQSGRGKNQRKEIRLLSLLAMVAAGGGMMSLLMACGVLAASGREKASEREAAPEAIMVSEIGDEPEAERMADMATVSEIAAPASEAIQGSETDGTCESVTAPAKQRNDDAPLVAIDAGHGGCDEGCSFAGVYEKDINLAIACFLQDELEGRGYRVLMVRTDDSYLTKEERAAVANRQNADIYVSIHQNSGDKVVCGTETWYDQTDENPDTKRLAQLIQKYTARQNHAAKQETTDRGLMDGSGLYVTSKTQMPSCLVETGFLSNEKERLLLTTIEYQKKLASGIAEGIDLYFHPKTMYLTFDDGPSVTNTTVVLDILKERGIRATFFLVGENVRKYPEIAQRIVEEGHTVGIHCDNHDYRVIYESVDSYLADFEAAHQTVWEVTGVDAKLYRFPGGSINAYDQEVWEEIARRMSENGYIYFDWNASMEDAVKNPDAETLLYNAQSSILGRKKVVLLAHDVVAETGQCLEELLDSLPEYEMKPLTEDVEPIQFAH